MFNIKNLINRVTNSNDGSNADESSPSHSHQPLPDEDSHSAEGFLCPLCMTAFSSPDALKVHYESLHNEPGEPNSDDRSDNLSEIGEDIKNMQLEIESLQTSLHKERNSSKEVLTNFQQLQSDMKLLDTQLQSLKVAEKELQAANALLTSDVTLLRQQLGERIEQISQLRKDNEQTVVNMTGEIDKMKQENGSLKMQLAHRNSIDDAAVLKQELVSVQKMMDQLSLEKEDEIRSMKQEIIDLKKKSHEREQAFADAQLKFCENLKAQSPTEVLETQANIKLEQCMNTNEQLQRQLTEVEAAKNDLETISSNMKKEKESCEVQISDLKKNMHNLRLELEQSGVELGRLVSETTAQSEQIGKLTQQLREKNEVQEELARSKDKLIQVEQRFSLLKEEMKTLTENYNSGNQELESRVAELASINSSLQSEMEKQDGDLKNSRGMITELQNSLAIAQEEKNADCTRVQQMQSEVDKLMQVKQELESQLQKIQQEKMELSKKLTTIEAQLGEVKAKLKALENEKVELSDKIKRGQQDVRELRESQNESKTRYEAQIAKLQTDLRQIGTELIASKREKDETLKSYEAAKAELEKQISELNANEKSFHAQMEERERNVNQLKTEMSEAVGKAEKLQSQMDSILVEKLEYEKNIKLSEHKYAVLLERCLAADNEKEKLHDAMSDLKRKLEDSTAALHELGRENQNLVMESAKLNGRQWADDSLATICTTCEREFTLTNRKHHCRHCGQIFCKDCSSKTAKIPSSKNPVRVCDACFDELMPK